MTGVQTCALPISFDGAGPSYGTGPSHGAGPTDDDITSLGIWAEEEQQEEEQQEEEWEKDWDSDSEQQRHQEWQESEQQLLRMFRPPNPDAYHHNDPRHWVEVNRRDGIPPFRTLLGQPWGARTLMTPQIRCTGLSWIGLGTTTHRATCPLLSVLCFMLTCPLIYVDCVGE